MKAMSLRGKVVGLAVLAASLPVIITILLMIWQQEEMVTDVRVHVEALGRREAEKITRSIYQMAALAYRHAVRQLESSAEDARREMRALGPLRLADDEVTHIIHPDEGTAPPTRPGQAPSTETRRGTPRSVTFRPLQFGETVMDLNTRIDVPSPLVDLVARYNHLDCTLWQKIRVDGEPAFLRVQTSWNRPDGSQRGAGTYLTYRPDAPVHGEAWTRSQSLRRVMEGKPVVTCTIIAEHYYVAYFFPIVLAPRPGAPEEVVGMFGFGMRMKELIADLRESVLPMKVGTRGYAGALGVTRDYAGRYIISQGGQRDFEYIGDDPAVREMIGMLLAADPDPLDIHAAPQREPQVLFHEYTWKNPGEDIERTKTSAIAYFKPFDWGIYAGIYHEDFEQVNDEILRNMYMMGGLTLAAGVLVLLVSVGMAMVLGRRIVQPIERIVEAATEIAGGNLREARARLHLPDPPREGADLPTRILPVPKQEAEDETGRMYAAIRQMTGNLISLVSQVQRASVQLVSAATEIGATSRHQQSTTRDFETHVAHVVAAVREISATSRELAQTMQGVMERTQATSATAEEGKAGIERMSRTMRELQEATRAISEKLARIHENASDIGSVVVTITKVAEQTNLLSLNAAIEAEKAGEYGLGFTVVAREIRRLADQTAVATLDIERMVRDMQASVGAGVMEIDRFTHDVQESVETSDRITRQLSDVIGEVQALGPRFEKVNDGMRMQSEGAEQISNSMGELSEGAKQLAASSTQFGEAAEQLKESASALQTEVARFKVT